MTPRYFYNAKIPKKIFKEKKVSIISRRCSLENDVFKTTFFNCEFYKNNLKNIKFNKCTFKNTVFNSTNLNRVIFINCKFLKVEFSHTELKSKSFLNCKFKNIDFNLTMIDKKNSFPTKLINKNKNDIIFKYNNKLIHNKKRFPFLKKVKKNKKERNYFFNSNISYLNNNHSLFKKLKFSYNYKKISNSSEKSITNDLLYGSGLHICKPNFLEKVLVKAAHLCLKASKLKKGNCLDKRKNYKTVNNLYALDKIFFNLLPQKKIKNILERILGENYYSGLYSANVFLPGSMPMAFHFDYPYTTMETNKHGVIKNFSHNNPVNIQSLLFITDVNKYNGYSLFVPGTQTLQADIKKQKIYMNENETIIVFKLNKKWHKYKILSLEGKRGTMVIFNGLMWHAAGENNSYNKNRITANNQFLPNYVRPMHLLKKTKLSKNFFSDKIRGQNFIYPVEF